VECAKCKAGLVTRQGRFGPFLACPNSRPGDNHGTASVPTGQRAYEAAYHAAFVPRPPDLDQLVQQGVMALGGGRMSDLDLFVEGGPETGDYEDDHWTNVRPY